ncbi:MAG: FAD-dependent oxidoreductase, partial [Pseudolabrys sp.]|nr:FAD-dependent oxidoreductase [Pseudolabrys sp.]
MNVAVDADVEFDTRVPLAIVGAGASGLCAALAARERNIEAIVIERDAVPSGSTALSAGLVPAAGTRFQRDKGIDDSPELFAADLQRKARGEACPILVHAIARESAPLIEWLVDRYDLPFSLIDNFFYPGHSALRMHGLPSRSGRELVDRLRKAAEASDAVILVEATVDTLFSTTGGLVRGVEVTRGNGKRERIGCDALILACGGFGGNPELVRRFIPEMVGALYFGHPGNRGDAVLWGEALGAKLAFLSAYQGHGSVATPHNILITWAIITEGGFQVNAAGRRFCDESRGYSEQAVEVLRQPGRIAWSVFDARIARIARQFEDFRTAERAGAVLSANNIDDLARVMHVPASPFKAEWEVVERIKASGGRDRYGRPFTSNQTLAPPFHAVRVTGALFHTQGGLAVDATGRVKRAKGDFFPNLFAAGGAAAGISGNRAEGYLSGNGLLTAMTLGRLAGRAA